MLLILTQRSSFSFNSVFIFMIQPPPSSTLFPYTTLFRSVRLFARRRTLRADHRSLRRVALRDRHLAGRDLPRRVALSLRADRSEEHTSELQSRRDLVCRLLLEKKKKE